MKYIYSLLTISTILIPLHFAFAQSFTIKGKILDAESSKPLEFANIALLNPVDSALITGNMTDLEGKFTVEVPAGNYIFRAGFMGYEDFSRAISIGSKPNFNAGTIRLQPTSTNLQEVTVEGVASIFESDIDKRRYHVENSIVAEGATAAELLGTLPSIQVDDEGGITMRGSGNILIFINGRPSSLSGDDAESLLAQFPANSIKTIELITNPSSQYDAVGVGGIINVILKKEENLGFNGQINGSIGTRDKYTSGLNLNYGAGKINWFGAYNYQNRRLFRESENLRTNNLSGVSPILDQDSYGETKDENHLVRTGFDFQINDNKVLGYNLQANWRNRSRSDLLSQRSLNSNQQLDSLFLRDTQDFRTSSNLETGLNFTWDIDSLGHRLYTSFSYAIDQRDQQEIFQQLFFNNVSTEVPENRLDQLSQRPQNSKLYLFQLDYEKPLTHLGIIGSGLKGTFRNWERSQDFFQSNASNNFTPTLDEFFTEGFQFTENVLAAYLNLKNNIGKFGYQAGLRAEYTETLGVLESTNQNIPNNYFNVFPSAFLNYHLKNEQEISANYSRRISRPGIWGLAPIFQLNDLFNLSVGNPFLQPEFTNSYEIAYMKGWKNYLLHSTFYHRYSTNVETRVIQLSNNNVAIQTRENANQRSNSGLELVNQIQVNQWFDLNLTGNFFYSEITGDNIAPGFNNSNFSWTVSLLANLAIPNFASLQINGNYRGPIVLPQGQIEPIWGLNAGLRKNVLNRRGTLSLNVSDIFNTRIFRITTEDPRFSQVRMFNRETRIGTLSFTYRFGGYKGKGEQKRDRNEFDDDNDF